MLIGSTNSLTPCDSNTWSPEPWPFSSIIRPYGTIQAFSTENLLDSAQRRWQAIREARPDLEPALALQRELLTRMIDLAETLAGGRLPRLSLPPKYLAAKLTR